MPGSVLPERALLPIRQVRYADLARLAAEESEHEFLARAARALDRLRATFDATSWCGEGVLQPSARKDAR
jgi:hypothetical protein